MTTARRSMMALLPAACLTLLLAAATFSLPAVAQDVYRCEENGRVVFSDKPCRLARPATPAAAPRTASEPTAGAPGLGYATREQGCADGSQKACDEIACIRNDMDACKRIGGLRGSFWFEESRRRATLRATTTEGKPSLRRVTIHKLRCTGNRKDRSADVTADGDGYRLDTGKTVYPSIDAAATALCRG